MNVLKNLCCILCPCSLIDKTLNVSDLKKIKIIAFTCSNSIAKIFYSKMMICVMVCKEKYYLQFIIAYLVIL
jgi:hypothetical protein